MLAPQSNHRCVSSPWHACVALPCTLAPLRGRAALHGLNQNEWRSRRVLAAASLALFWTRLRPCSAVATTASTSKDLSEGMATPAAAVVLLHGSGDSGDGLRRLLTQTDNGHLLTTLNKKGVVLRFPDSGVRPYSLMGGMPLSIWYDRTGLAPTSPEDTASVETSVKQLLGTVEELQALGIPANRIVIGGFSMGGGIALQFVLRHPKAVGAAFVLSSFMCDDAAVYTKLMNKDFANQIPPILMVHGEADTFIKTHWGKATAERLQNLRIPVEFISLPRVRHEVTRREVKILEEWLFRVLQFDLQSDGPNLRVQEQEL